MAEERDELLPEFDENEEDVLLQVQMKIYNFIMGYWKQGLMAIGVILLGVLGQGLYAEHVQDQQRSIHSDIEMIKADLPEVNPMSMYGAPADNPNDMKRMETLRNAAAEIEKVAEKAEDSAKWFAWMEAARTWKRANETDAEIVALQKAIEASQDPTFRYSATLQLANCYQNAENSEKVGQAISLLEEFIASAPAVGLEQARLNLAQIYKEAGKLDKSKEQLDALAGNEFLSAPEVQALVTGMIEE